MVGVEEGREFRFLGDLYSQESTFPLVLHFIEKNERVSFSVTWLCVYVFRIVLCVSPELFPCCLVSLFAPNAGDEASISCGVEMIENGFFTFPLRPFL